MSSFLHFAAYICPDGTTVVARDKVCNQVLMKRLLHDDLNQIIVLQVCDGYQDCPQTSKSNGGEDEDDCGDDGDSLEISIIRKKTVPCLIFQSSNSFCSWLQDLLINIH